MRYIISEYGVLVASIIGVAACVFVCNNAQSMYKDFSTKFIGALTGNTISYDSTITIEQIEGGEFG